MPRIEVLLTDLGELATHDIAETEKTKGLAENMNVAKRGGKVAKDAWSSYEKATKKTAISKNKNLNYKYIENNNKLENK